MTLDPPPCVALGVRDSAGQWQLALVALHCQSPPKGLQEAAYTPKAISDRLGKGVDSSLTNGSRLYTCESKYRQAYRTACPSSSEGQYAVVLDVE